MNILKLGKGKRGITLSGVLLVIVSFTPLLFGRVFSFAPDEMVGEVALAGEVASTGDVNVQTMKLAEASLSLKSEAVKGIGGGEISIVDQSALVSEMGPGGTEADVFVKESTPGADKISIYIVREGDSLNEVAEMFGVTANTIVWANDLSSKTIKPGQEIVILPVVGVRHEVEKGDTLESVVKKYKADLGEVARYNGVDEENDLVVGTTLMIPNGEVVAPAAKRTTSAQASSGSGLIRPARGVKTQGIHGYNGVDIAASVGTPIVAAAGGQVIIARWGSWNGGYGNYVVIKHNNGMQTLYAHLNSIGVSQGQWVSQGQSIGTMGNTGRSTGPHLHFEVRGGHNPF